MSIGEVLKERRIELNIKQDDLAERLNVTVQSVSKWERGINEPKASRVSQLAKELQLTEREICRGERDKSSDVNPFEFMMDVGSMLNGLSDTELIMTIYEYVNDKDGFIEALAQQSNVPHSPKKIREMNHAQDMLSMYEQGKISFSSEEEKEKCLLIWKNALSE
ncbi:helix-turn-helix domain-containing protein [Vibrio mimicus]|nr:helix-turn-helix transcriptional regulator [Vibrio mimicus]